MRPSDITTHEIAFPQVMLVQRSLNVLSLWGSKLMKKRYRAIHAVLTKEKTDALLEALNQYNTKGLLTVHQFPPVWSARRKQGLHPMTITLSLGGVSVLEAAEALSKYKYGIYKQF